jgi:hypothetical protein
MRLTPIDPRRWVWEHAAHLRVDIYRAERDGVATVEECIVDDAEEDIRVVLQQIEDVLRPGDSFRLYATAIDEQGDPGLIRLV